MSIFTRTAQLRLWMLLLITKPFAIAPSQASKWRKSTESRCFHCNSDRNKQPHTYTHTRNRFSPQKHSTSDAIWTWHWIHQITWTFTRDNTVYHRNTRFINTKQFIKQQYERESTTKHTKTWVTICCSLDGNAMLGAYIE